MDHNPSGGPLKKKGACAELQMRRQKRGRYAMMSPMYGGMTMLVTVSDILANSRERRQQWIEEYLSGVGAAPASYLTYCDVNPEEAGDPRGGVLPSPMHDTVLIDGVPWVLSKGYCREDVARSIYNY